MPLTINKKHLAPQWETKKLGDICDLQNGYAFKSDSYINYSKTLNIRMSNIRPSGEFDPEHNIRFLPDSFAPKYAQFLLKDGDLIVAMTDMAGDPKILGLPTLVNKLDGRNFLLNQRVGKLHSFSNQVDVSYLRYFLSSPEIKEYYKSKGTGGLQINISKKDILSATIPVPPLSEQKRIVAIVDEAFEGIDRAIANTQKNLTNARELFESYLNAIFTQKGDGWVEKKLQDILIVQSRNGWSPPAQNHSDSGTPVLTLSSVTGFQFNKSKVKFTNATTKKGAHYWLKNGEFLITRSNTTELVGHVAICEGLTEPTICCDLIMKMQIDPTQADTKFIYWHFRTRALRDLISSSAQGANPTMKKINKSIVQNLPVVVPEISVQKDIVAKIDAIATETQRLEAIYKQKFSALNELKQSLLQKAFTGELTTDTANQVTKTAKEVIAA